MALLLTGVFLILLGVFCAIVLVLAPLGLMAAPSELLLWVMFPSLCLVGFFLLAMVGKTRQVIQFTFWVSCALLLLALTAVTCLVLSASALIAPVSNPMSLWYVLIVGGTLGALGAATSRPSPAG